MLIKDLYEINIFSKLKITYDLNYTNFNAMPLTCNAILLQLNIMSYYITYTNILRNI